MASNYAQKQYAVDIVMCIDATGSMRRIIQTVKENAKHMYNDICAAMKAENRDVASMRLRLVVFRDYLAYVEDKIPPMIATRFFNMPTEINFFSRAIDAIEATGGGDDPEDGLEALATALKSDWCKPADGISPRHIVIFWTDADAHDLPADSASGAKKLSVDCYPPFLKNGVGFKTLTEWWGDAGGSGNCMNYEAKRLLLYAPESGYWNEVANWSNVIHIQVEADNWASTLSEFERSAEYKEVVQLLIHTINV